MRIAAFWVKEATKMSAPHGLQRVALCGASTPTHFTAEKAHLTIAGHLIKNVSGCMVGAAHLCLPD